MFSIFGLCFRVRHPAKFAVFANLCASPPSVWCLRYIYSNILRLLFVVAHALLTFLLLGKMNFPDSKNVAVSTYGHCAIKLFNFHSRIPVSPIWCEWITSWEYFQQHFTLIVRGRSCSPCIFAFRKNEFSRQQKCCGKHLQRHYTTKKGILQESRRKICINLWGGLVIRL